MARRGSVLIGPTAQNPDITGSVPARRAPEPAPVGHWTWDGGSPVTVGQGETVESIARQYGVPASAILETNGIANAASIRPGQRLVIPRYISAMPLPPARMAPAALASARAHGAEDVHIVRAGRKPDRHRAPSRRLAHGAGARQQHPALQQDRHRRPSGGPGRPSRRGAPARRRRGSSSRARSRPQAVTGTTENARIAKPEAPVTESVSQTARSRRRIAVSSAGRCAAASSPASAPSRMAGRTTASIWRFRKAPPIKAADDGVVAYAGNELKGYGNLVLVRHANGYVSPPMPMPAKSWSSAATRSSADR